MDDPSIGLDMRELLARLESREREIIVAKIWGGLTFDQIGAALGEPKVTIWRTYQSGITKLKEAYGEFSDE
ncbi:MAG: sigma factor-like helix-turn-helix DNA-binding protein [Planctomycetaceae bacterium]